MVRRERSDLSAILGFLTDSEFHEDQTFVQNLIKKYGLSIEPHPALMLDQFTNQVLKNNIKLEDEDLERLGNLLRRVGGAIAVGYLSGHLRKFLEDAAMIFNKPTAS